MTLQQVHEHADSIDLDGLMAESSLLESGAETPEIIVSKICGVYGKVRPILEVIGNLFFVPKKWRAVINTFIVVLDGLCPQT